MKYPEALFALIILLALILRAPYLTREFGLEEALHVKVIRSVSQTGYPYSYLGEQTSQKIFMDRTPLLFFFFVPAVKLLGISEFSIRLTPLIFSLAETALIFYFTVRFAPTRIKYPSAAIAGLIFALHPYFIQTALQIHFDNGIFTFLTTLYLFTSFGKIIKKNNSFWDYWQLAAIFFFIFAIKFENALMLIAILTAFALLVNRNFLKKYLLTSIFAIFLFLGLFALYNQAYNQKNQFFIPIERQIILFRKVFIPKYTSVEINSQTRSQWANNYYLLIRFLSWLSIPTIVLSIYCLVAIWKKSQLRGNNYVKFLLLWIFAISGIFLAGGWAGDFPRYFGPIFSALSGVLGIVIAQKIKKHLATKSSFVILILSAALATFATYNGYLFLDHITGFIPNLQIPFFMILAISALFIFLVKNSEIFMFKFLILLLFLNFAQMALQNLHNVKSHFSLTNFYGLSGSKNAGLFLKRELDPDSVILTLDQIAYYWNGQYYDYGAFGYPNIDQT